MKTVYLSGLIVGILVSELCNGTSYHLSHIGLHKQMSAIQNVDYEFLRRRQCSVQVDYKLSHRYVTAKENISKCLSEPKRTTQGTEERNSKQHLSCQNPTVRKSLEREFSPITTQPHKLRAAHLYFKTSGCHFKTCSCLLREIRGGNEFGERLKIILNTRILNL